MLILNKKHYIIKVGILTVLAFLFLGLEAQAAISQKVKQVKTKNSAAVYFLQHSAHRKKAYLNAAAYLSYGNKWSAVKTVSDSDLNSWPEAKLIKVKTSPAIYYIQDNKKVLIKNMTDLRDFSLGSEPIIEVNETDLNQYQTVTYEEMGLRRASGLLVFNDLVTNQNNNSLLTNTGGNLVGIFRFRSPSESATITSLTFYVSGVYSSSILDGAFVSNETGTQYEANVSLNKSERRIYINFPTPLAFNPGEEKTVEVFLNFKTCSCNNQALRVELRAASDVLSSIPASANFPLKGTEFKLVSSAALLAQLKTQELTLVGSNLSVSNGSRLIGKFNLAETSGNEEVLVKRLTFANDGSAGKDDWEDFRLMRDGQIIARVNTVDANDKIVFDINYLKIGKNASTELTVLAGLKNDYRPAATFDLQVNGLWAVGRTNNFSLQPEINNLGETYSLN